MPPTAAYANAPSSALRAVHDAIELLSTDLFEAPSLETIAKIVEFLPRLTDEPAAFHATFCSVTSALFANKIAATPAECAALKLGPLARAWFDFQATLKLPDMPQTADRDCKDGLRIPILVHQLTAPPHAPTYQSYNMVKAINARPGARAAVINTNIMPQQVESSYVGQYIANRNDAMTGWQNVEFDGVTIPIYSNTDKAFSITKIALTIAHILSLKPAFAVTYGGWNIVADILSRYCPVVLTPSAREEQVGAAHVYLGADETLKDKALLRIENNPVKPRYIDGKFAVILPDKRTSPSRADFGLAEDAVVFTMVGNRLSSEIDETVEAAMTRILEAAPNAAFAIVGPDPIDWKSDALKAQLDRIVYVPFQYDLRAFFALTDAYFNPPRQGGGLSARLALVEGLPVLACGGDVADIIGNDKVDADFDSQIVHAIALAGDAQGRATEGQRSLEIHAGLPSFDGYIDNVLYAGELAREAFWSGR